MYSIIVTALLLYISYKHFKVYISRLALIAYLISNNIDPTDKEQKEAVRFVLKKAKSNFGDSVKMWFRV